MSDQIYPPPVDQLLTLGEPASFSFKPDQWIDYRALGLTHEHVPDLIRLATDYALHTGDSDTPAVWAPLHAWRALGQLRAEEAVEPLLSLFHEIDDDWMGEELPEVFGLIGSAAITPLSVYLADDSHGWFPPILATASLARIGLSHPESRDECVAVLANQLEHYKANEPGLNGFLINALCDLGAVEAVSVIRRAFNARRVDEMIMGGWQDVQEALGLIPPSDMMAEEARLPRTFIESGGQEPSDDLGRQRQKRKARRKKAAKSRKRNRRR
jgi:hypothetical protein